ncbi:MAG TPA: metal-dependent hydrolase [Bryobacteraceae bacterium]
MDNLTHSLTGLVLARAGLNRFSPCATMLLLISANIPDIDIVALGWGPMRYFEFHRGYTHSLVGLPVMALLSVLLTAALCRRKLPWFRAWLICLAGVASHLLLDWTNDYGIRLLLPFSSRWFALDLNSLVDVVILCALAIAAIWPLFARLVGSEIGERKKRPAGRRLAIAALVFVVLFDGGRAVLHARAEAQLWSRLYQNVLPVRTAALPNPLNPFRWRGIVETPNAYRVLSVNTFGELHPDSAVVFYQPFPSPALRSAKATAPFRHFLAFARFPVWSIEPGKIAVTDLRFGTPEHSSFRCIALVNTDGELIESRLAF